MVGSKVDIAIRARDQASPALAKVDKQLAGLEMSAAGLMGMLGGGYALARVADFTWEMGKLGAESLDTRASFEAMMRSVGQSPALLNEMRQAAGGTVSDLKLMQNASFALAGTSGELATALAEAQPKMLEIARAAYKMNPALGSVQQLYQALNTGVKRNTPLLIDNLGIVVKQAEAQKEYAKQLGKSVKDLTTAEQQLALLNATMEGGSTLIQQIGGDVSSAGDAFAELDAVLANLKTTTAEAFTPATVAVAKHLTIALGGAVDVTRRLIGVRLRLVDAQKELNKAQEAENLTAIAGWQRKINELEKEQTQLLAQGASTLSDYVDLWARMPGLVQTATDAIRDFGGKRGGLGVHARGPGWGRQVPDIVRESVKAEEELRKESARDTADRVRQIWENAYRDQRSTLESIMQPTQAFDATGMLDALGQHVDTWDEAARRMADVANKGAESPWAKMLDIPEDVLAAGGDKLKGYAANYVRDFYLGLHSADIDKEAIKDIYRKMVGGKAERETMLTEIQKELGAVDMSLLRKAAGMQNPAQEMISAWAKGVDDGTPAIEGIGGKFGNAFMEGVLDADAVVSFVDALAQKIMDIISDWGDEE